MALKKPRRHGGYQPPFSLLLESILKNRGYDVQVLYSAENNELKITHGTRIIVKNYAHFVDGDTSEKIFDLLGTLRYGETWYGAYKAARKYILDAELARDSMRESY